MNRLEETGKSAARADGVHQMAVSENDRFTVGEIGGNHSHGDAQVFKTARFKNAIDKIPEAVIAGETQAGNSPAGDIAEAQRTARGNDASQRSPAGVSRTKNAAHAGAGDGGDGNVILL